MPSKNLSRNGLDQALADLAAAQTSLVKAQAAPVNNQAAFQANFLALEPRLDAQFDRIRLQFEDIRAILTRHETQFQTILLTLAGLPEAVQRRIGFREAESHE